MYKVQIFVSWFGFTDFAVCNTAKEANDMVAKYSNKSDNKFQVVFGPALANAA